MNASLPATAHDPSALQTELTTALSQIVFDDALPWEHEDTTSYKCDDLTTYQQMPLVIVLPDTEAQVTEILRMCRRMSVPVMPRGAGTNPSGGVMPAPDGLVLPLIKLKRITKVDLYTQTAVVQLGICNLVISEAVNLHGLCYTPDPSSQIACTIGSNMNENSGGVHRLKYGLTVHSVLRVCAIMMSDEVVELGSEAPDTPGFDSLITVVGPEGMLAVVTEVTVRLVLKSQFVQVTMASFSGVESGGNTMANVIAAGITPMRLGMMDKPATVAVEELVCAGHDLDAAATLLYGSGSIPGGVVEEIVRMSEMLRASDATRIQVSQSEAKHLRFWGGRKNAFPATGRILPDYYCMDSTTPRRHIGTLLWRVRQIEQKHVPRCINVFHASDSNMHPFILFNDEDQNGWHRAELFGSDILETCVKLGGIIIDEHGVDMEKPNSMCMQSSVEERGASLRVKATLDLVRLLNPDRVVPTSVRCAEYDKLHVRNGLLPHPDLPRF